MEINSERVGNTLIVMSSENRVDGTNARDFQVGLEAAIEETDRAVIFDAETLTYISSAGLRAILLIVKSINRQAESSPCVRCLIQYARYSRSAALTTSSRSSLHETKHLTRSATKSGDFPPAWSLAADHVKHVLREVSRNPSRSR